MAGILTVSVSWLMPLYVRELESGAGCGSRRQKAEAESRSRKIKVELVCLRCCFRGVRSSGKPETVNSKTVFSSCLLATGLLPPFCPATPSCPDSSLACAGGEFPLIFLAATDRWIGGAAARYRIRRAAFIPHLRRQSSNSVFVEQVPQRAN